MAHPREPLLELPLLRRAVGYVAAERPAGKRVRYLISTNGLLLDDDAAAFLAEHRIETQVSFDGVEAAQDERGAGTHAKLDALLDRLRREHPDFFRRDFNTAIALHSGNLHHLADSVDYFLDKQVPRIDFGVMFTHDPGWTEGHRGELERQFARIFERSARHYEATGEVPSTYSARRPIPPATIGRGGGCAVSARARRSQWTSTGK